MKLFSIGVPYTKVSKDILALHSRIAILEALRWYGGNYTRKELQQRTPYSRRQRSEALRELEQRGLLSLDESGIPAEVDIPPHKLAEVPTRLQWDALTPAELKVTLALYFAARHQRAPYFTWEGTQEELAELAKLNRKATGQALHSLAAKGILSSKAVRDTGSRTTRGTFVQLLDPESGVSLNDIAWAFRNRLQELDVATRYKLALKPQLDHHSGYTAESGMLLTCPFCLNSKRTFRVTMTEQTDRCHCFACGRSGDSLKLCALRSFHLFKEPQFNLTALKAYMGQEQHEPAVSAAA